MEISLKLRNIGIHTPKVMVNFFVTNNCAFPYSLSSFLYFLIHSISKDEVNLSFLFPAKVLPLKVFPSSLRRIILGGAA